MKTSVILNCLSYDFDVKVGFWEADFVYINHLIDIIYKMSLIDIIRYLIYKS